MEKAIGLLVGHVHNGCTENKFQYLWRFEWEEKNKNIIPLCIPIEMWENSMDNNDFKLTSNEMMQNDCRACSSNWAPPATGFILHISYLLHAWIFIHVLVFSRTVFKETWEFYECVHSFSLPLSVPERGRERKYTLLNVYEPSSI